MPKERIELIDTPMSAMIKLAEGNPGAITVMMKLFEDTPKIDPQSAFGGFGTILSLDTNGIYGSQIWVLYKDVCGENILNVLTLLRSLQMDVLIGGLFDQGRDFDALRKNLNIVLPSFNPAVQP